MLERIRLSLKFFWIVILILFIKINFFFESGALIDIFYYVILGFGFLIFIKHSVSVVKIFPVLNWIILFHLVYFGFVEIRINGISPEAISYFLARICMMIFACFCIYLNPKYFKEKFLSDFSKIALVATISGLFLFNFINNKWYGLFNNPSATGTICAIGLIFWQINLKRIRRFYFLAGNLVFIVAILLTQSRAALISIGVLLMFYGSKSIKAFAGIAILSILVLLLFSSEIKTLPGINRIFNQTQIFEGRDIEYKYAVYKIKMKPLTGWGMADNKNELSSKVYKSNFDDALGAHNSYLFLAQIFGVIFAPIFIILILIPFLKKAALIFKKKLSIQILLYLSAGSYLIIHSAFESYLIGIGHLVGFLFFVIYFNIVDRRS